jgi:peptide/nickel transport system permease protein
MPEPLPSDSRLLEPSGGAYELAVLIDSDTARTEREFSIITEETDADSYVKKTLGLAFWIAVGWFGLIAVLAVLAPLLTSWGILKDPFAIPAGRAQFRGPSSTYWLGTDNLGRDQLSRLVYGTRVSLPVGFASIGLGLLVGTTIGLTSGYLKGRVDNILMSFMDIILAFPALLLALAIIAFTESPDIAHISLAIGIVSIPPIARLVRASTLTFREREFVLASRTLGASHGRIIARDILPNVVPPVLSFAVIGVALAIAVEASLAFVGVSVPLPQSTWGGMIQQASTSLNDHPYQVFLPCLVLVLTIMALYFIGDRLRQYFDVKESAL